MGLHITENPKNAGLGMLASHTADLDMIPNLTPHKVPQVPIKREDPWSTLGVTPPKKQKQTIKTFWITGSLPESWETLRAQSPDSPGGECEAPHHTKNPFIWIWGGTLKN